MTTLLCHLGFALVLSLLILIVFLAQNWYKLVWNLVQFCQTVCEAQWTIQCTGLCFWFVCCTDMMNYSRSVSCLLHCKRDPWQKSVHNKNYYSTRRDNSKYMEQNKKHTRAEIQNTAHQKGTNISQRSNPAGFAHTSYLTEFQGSKGCRIQPKMCIKPHTPLTLQ